MSTCAMQRPIAASLVPGADVDGSGTDGSAASVPPVHHLVAAFRAWRSYRGAGLATRAFLAARLAALPLRALSAELVRLEGRVLGVGSGHGIVARWLAELNPAVTVEGVDIDPQRVAVAQATEAASPRVRICVADVLALKVTEPYDGALLVDVVHHIDATDHAQLAEAVANAVRPDGAVLIKDVGRSPAWKHALNRAQDRLVTGRWSDDAREPAELAELFEQAGFRLEHPLDPPEEPVEPLAPSQQRGGALEPLRPRRLAHPLVELRQEAGPGVGREEDSERLLDLAPVGVRIEVAEARRAAAAHLAVRRRVLAQLQPAPAVAQPEHRRELVGQLLGGAQPLDRADVDRVAGRGVGRRFQHGVLDVQPAAQERPLVGALERLVAARLPRLDQPVLQDERAELGVRRAVVDDRRALGPAGRRAEVRPRAAAQRDRLADVQRPAVPVAEDVDAGIRRQRAEVRALALRHARVERAAAAAPARAQVVDRLLDRGRGGAHARQQRAEDARARDRVGQRSVDLVDVDAERSRQRREPALARERREPARHRKRADDRRARPAHAAALERLAQRAAVERGVVCHQHAPFEQLRDPRQHLFGFRRGGDHALRDAGEALDAARERRPRANERRPALVQLTAADQDGADLGQLAGRSRAAVRLDVDCEVLGFGGWG